MKYIEELEKIQDEECILEEDFKAAKEGFKKVEELFNQETENGII